MSLIGVFPTLSRDSLLSDLTYHKDINENLAGIIKNDDFGHLLFYGPQGSGRRTRIRCLLNEIFGKGAGQVHRVTRTLTTDSNKKVEYSMLSSVHHVEFAVGELGDNDIHVMQEIIKEMAQTRQLNATEGGKQFKVIFIFEADKLSLPAQHALRRTMEKWAETCKMFLCVDSLLKICDPLRSRCLTIRVPSPTDQEMATDLKLILDKYFGAPLSVEDINPVLLLSNGNMRRALILLEVYKQQGSTSKRMPQSYERIIDELVTTILRTQNKDSILAIRGRVNELLTRMITGSVIIKNMCLGLTNKMPPHLHTAVWALANEYCYKILLGSKEIFHVEAFVAGVMSIIVSNRSINGL
uniref:AAA domain-containing protein n=1 Tax=Rhabditophanes sp. KR3021 TaxID=114890 RepID=A0AC35TPM3_9BILA